MPQTEVSPESLVEYSGYQADCSTGDEPVTKSELIAAINNGMVTRLKIKGAVPLVSEAIRKRLIEHCNAYEILQKTVGAMIANGVTNTPTAGSIDGPMTVAFATHVLLSILTTDIIDSILADIVAGKENDEIDESIRTQVSDAIDEADLKVVVVAITLALSNVAIIPAEIPLIQKAVEKTALKPLLTEPAEADFTTVAAKVAVANTAGISKGEKSFSRLAEPIKELVKVLL